MTELKLHQIIKEVLDDNFDASTGQIVNIHKEISDFAKTACNNITDDQIKFVSQAASIIFFEFYNRMDNVTKDLATAITSEINK